MKREVNNAIDTFEDIGDNVFAIAMIAPDILKNAITLGKDVVVIPLSVIKGTTEYTANKVDQTVDMVV
jgi:hypothetical protein